MGLFLIKNQIRHQRVNIKITWDTTLYSFSACTIMGPSIFLRFNDESAAIFRAIKFKTNKSILHVMIWFYTKKFSSHFLACTTFSSTTKENICVSFTRRLCSSPCCSVEELWELLRDQKLISATFFWLLIIQYINNTSKRKLHSEWKNLLFIAVMHIKLPVILNLKMYLLSGIHWKHLKWYYSFLLCLQRREIVQQTYQLIVFKCKLGQRFECSQIDTRNY